MTYEEVKEALESAKGGLRVYEEQYPHLKEHIKFQKVIINVLEKQMPKKPKARSVRYGIEYSVEYSCSKCGRYVGDEYVKKTTVAIADRL